MIDDVQLGPGEHGNHAESNERAQFIAQRSGRETEARSCPHGRIKRSRLENEIRGFVVFLAPARNDDRHADGTYRANRAIREWIQL